MIATCLSPSRIKSVRVDAGYSIDDVAHYMKLPKQVVESWEQTDGQYVPINSVEFEQLIMTLGVPKTQREKTVKSFGDWLSKHVAHFYFSRFEILVISSFMIGSIISLATQ